MTHYDFHKAVACELTERFNESRTAPQPPIPAPQLPIPAPQLPIPAPQPPIPASASAAAAAGTETHIRARGAGWKPDYHPTVFVRDANSRP